MKKYNFNLENFPSALIVEGGTKDERNNFALSQTTKLFCSTGADNCTCGSCVKIKTGSHPDFFFIDEENIKVEQTRQIIKNAYTKPSEAKQKVFIFEYADNLRQESQNALLKIVEEPFNCYFVFLCQNSKNLLQTLRSRCQVFTLGDVNDFVAKDELLLASKNFLPSLKSELALCQFFSQASSLSREDFTQFLTLLKVEIHSHLTSSNQIDIRLLNIYDYIDKLFPTLIVNPSIYAMSMAMCVKIWGIMEQQI